MSQANVDYVIKNNPEIDPRIVEICPNSAEIIDMRVDRSIKREMRDKYGIPHDKVVFVYGGNLGRPQGIPRPSEELRQRGYHHHRRRKGPDLSQGGGGAVSPADRVLTHNESNVNGFH